MATIEPIAHIETCYTTKFGVPRQAGIVQAPGRIVFEPPYRIADAVRGLEGFEYIWLVWQFSQAVRQTWSPTVRPPRLGGNERMGVFATRSPFRPNNLGLSSVQLQSIEYDTKLGPILHILGADLMDGTPIFDIKPYLPYTDSHPQARSGFATRPAESLLQVEYTDEVIGRLPCELRQPLIDTLAHDPRPQYQHDPERIYGITFAGHEVKFRIDDAKAYIITID